MRLPIFGLIATALTVCAPARANDLAERLNAIQKRLPEFQHSMDALRARGEDVSYPLVTYSTLDHFLPLASQDLTISVTNHWGWMSVNGCDAGWTPVKDAHS